VIREVVTDALLALATLTVVLSSVGIAVMPGAAAKLHYVTPAAVVAPVLVTLAVFVREGLDASTGMTVIALLFIVAVSPYVSHATIRAIRARSAPGERQ
jgi:multisubunit Na+/H+ antiporter MnhG subunit